MPKKNSANSHTLKDAIAENLKYSTKLSTSFSALSNFGSEGINIDSDKEDNFPTKRGENVILTMNNANDKNSENHYVRTNYYSNNTVNLDTMSIEENDTKNTAKNSNIRTMYSEKSIGNDHYVNEYENLQNAQNNVFNTNNNNLVAYNTQFTKQTSTPNYPNVNNHSMGYNSQNPSNIYSLENRVILEEEIIEEDSEKENSRNSYENIYDSKFKNKESPGYEKDNITLKEENGVVVKKKKKGPTLQELIPLNYLSEKAKFYQMNLKYNPQFIYSFEKLKWPYKRPHVQLLKSAKAILEATIQKYGNDSVYYSQFGRVITQEETCKYFDEYIATLNLTDKLTYIFTENTIAPTSVIHDENGTAKIIVSLPIMYQEKRVLDVLNHEVGTHFLRKHNEKVQVFYRERAKYGLKSYLCIEEGLASLNTVYEQAADNNKIPFLYQAALHYYSSYLGSIMGFEEMHSTLKKYISDPERLWKQCVRIKRGLKDTTKKGGMFKDQVYLRGALDLLKNRSKIDFVALHAGKLNLKDYFRLMKSNEIKYEDNELLLPYFLRDITKYKKALDRIAEANFIA